MEIIEEAREGPSQAAKGPSGPTLGDPVFSRIAASEGASHASEASDRPLASEEGARSSEPRGAGPEWEISAGRLRSSGPGFSSLWTPIVALRCSSSGCGFLSVAAYPHPATHCAGGLGLR